MDLKEDDPLFGVATLVAEGLEFPEGPVAMPDGSVCLVEIKRQTLTRIAADGSKTVLAELPGGPNGMAVGPGGDFYICNNGGFLFRTDNGFTRTSPGVQEGYTGGWIERIRPDGTGREVLYTLCGEHPLVGPNDLVFDRHGGFYFTDFGKMHSLWRANGGLYYALADGSRVVELAYPMITPNGVGISPDGATVYVSETESGRLWAFDLDAPGVVRKAAFPSPHGGRILATLGNYARLDSMAVDAEGNVSVATLTHGAVTTFDPAGKVIHQVMTGDPVTTNICFGGPGRRTAYVTLAGTGRLISMDWPRAGLELQHEA